MKKAIILLVALTFAHCLHAQSQEDPQSIGAVLDAQLFIAYNT